MTMESSSCLLGQLGRILMFLLLSGGCACSYFAAQTCEFFSYVEARQADVLPFPFTNLTEANVGVFGFIDAITGDCEVYDETFQKASDDFNAYFISAQFSAIVGPSCAALAWVLNVVEWFFWSHACTYMVVVILLLGAFAAQGLIFMVYGQREFCFDDRVAGDCSLEFGAYMAIAATSAFYAASIVWCCMPRSQPFCFAQGNKTISRESSHDDNAYGNNSSNANPRALFGDGDFQEQQQADEFTATGSDKKHDPSTGYNQNPNNDAWANSDNAGNIPIDESQNDGFFEARFTPNEQQQLQAQPQPHPDAPGLVTNHEDHTASWEAHESSTDDGNGMLGNCFENPFLLENSMQQDHEHQLNDPSRPAYGNLQG